MIMAGGWARWGNMLTSHKLCCQCINGGKLIALSQHHPVWRNGLLGRGTIAQQSRYQTPSIEAKYVLPVLTIQLFTHSWFDL